MTDQLTEEEKTRLRIGMEPFFWRYRESCILQAQFKGIAVMGAATVGYSLVSMIRGQMYPPMSRAIVTGLVMAGLYTKYRLDCCEAEYEYLEKRKAGLPVETVNHDYEKVYKRYFS